VQLDENPPQYTNSLLIASWEGEPTNGTHMQMFLAMLTLVVIPISVKQL
jgi:hypothetical protein